MSKFPCGFVANTDPSDEPGTHWIAFYFPSKQKGEFFDSYGKPPEYYHANFEKYLMNHRVYWTFNNKPLLHDRRGFVCYS